MRMLEQWNNLQCECCNNGTTYNANVGTIEQLIMRMFEQWNNLQCECWNNGTNYNVNVGTTYNGNVFQGEGRRRVSGKYGVGRANKAGRDLLDWCWEKFMGWYA